MRGVIRNVCHTAVSAKTVFDFINKVVQLRSVPALPEFLFRPLLYVHICSFTMEPRQRANISICEMNPNYGVFRGVSLESPAISKPTGGHMFVTLTGSEWLSHSRWWWFHQIQILLGVFIYLFIYVRLNTWQSIEPDQFKGFTPDVNWKCKTVKHG